MSKAVCCDRCGKCFVPQPKETYCNIKEIFFGDTVTFEEHEEIVDFCKECTVAFKQFMFDRGIEE